MDNNSKSPSLTNQCTRYRIYVQTSKRSDLFAIGFLVMASLLTLLFDNACIQDKHFLAYQKRTAQGVDGKSERSLRLVSIRINKSHSCRYCHDFVWSNVWRQWYWECRWASCGGMPQIDNTKLWKVSIYVLISPYFNLTQCIEIGVLTTQSPTIAICLFW